MNVSSEKIYLAALLHDIGKFYQRSSQELADTDFKRTFNSDLLQMASPDRTKVDFGLQHILWTCKFLELKSGKINSINDKEGRPVFAEKLFSNGFDDSLLDLSVLHHLPQTKAQAIIQLADQWSSGAKRTSENYELEKTEKFGKSSHKKVPLTSIFNYINNGKPNSAYNLTQLSLLNSCFPEEENFKKDRSKADSTVFEKSYSDLWSKFNSEFDNLPTSSYEAFTESLYFILKKYTWSIPANTHDMSYISLFEHLKTTAAIAESLFRYTSKFPESLLWDKIDEQPQIAAGHLPLLMVCWDISGIQNFIYNISGTKAAVSLKGRSFYLQLLIDSVIQRTLSDCKAYLGNVIYNSGGKLFMLLPNLPEIKDSLNRIHAEFESEIWSQHKGKIYLCKGIQQFSYNSNTRNVIFDGNEEGSISELWKKTIEAAAQNKSRKYMTVFIDENERKDKLSYDDLFLPQGNWNMGDEYKLCAVTGEEGIKNKSLFQIKKGEDVWVTKAVKDQSELGLALKDADHLLSYLNKAGVNFDVTGLEKAFKFRMEGIGVDHYLVDNSDMKKLRTRIDYPDNKVFTRIRGINLIENELSVSSGQGKSSSGFIFYGGNKQARRAANKDEDKTFEQLCEVRTNTGISQTFLGILRMDVDGLGKIFISGIPDKIKSFSTLSTLSAQLDWFFSGYINTLRNSDEFKDHVNVLYSGGDDLFAIGRWDKIIYFADKVRAELRSFVGRDDISISGGISIVGEKFPIRSGAEKAGEAELIAKKFRGQEKNAINIFGQTVSWKENDEWNEVRSLKNKFIELIGKENELSNSILHQFIKWKVFKDDNPSDLSYKWRSAYFLKRYKARYEGSNGGAGNSINEFLDRLIVSLFTGQGQFMKIHFSPSRYYDLAAVAARWAEMELKEEIKN